MSVVLAIMWKFHCRLPFICQVTIYALKFIASFEGENVLFDRKLFMTFDAMKLLRNFVVESLKLCCKDA